MDRNTCHFETFDIAIDLMARHMIECFGSTGSARRRALRIGMQSQLNGDESLYDFYEALCVRLAEYDTHGLG